MNQPTMEIGHNLESCTSKLKHIVLPPNAVGNILKVGEDGKLPRVILLDTPGFDDTYVDDVEILRRIAVWLAFSSVIFPPTKSLSHLDEVTMIV